MDASNESNNNSVSNLLSQVIKEKPNSKIDSAKKSTTVRQRPPSPAPYALHVGGEHAQKSTSPSSCNKPVTSSINTQSSSLKAPYAQPVLDASKLLTAKRVSNSVDDRIASVRERRLQKQQVQDDFLSVKRAKEELAQQKWEQAQEKRKQKSEEQKERDNLHRKEVEERKNKQLIEEKKRAEAIVARTEQQANVVLRQKRASSADRTKRWSWGAGGMSGGGGGMPLATRVESAPSPFYYYDPSRITKRLPNENRKRRPVSMNVSEVMFGHNGDERQNLSASSSGNIGQRKTSLSDDKFSKSPLVVSTAHMKFASGLRSYDSSPAAAASTSKKSSSPALPRHRRARSTEIRAVSSVKDKEASPDLPEKAQTKPSKRGRSPGLRKSASLKGASSTSPQLTEPLPVSSRLLAPTRSSIARSMNREFDELSNTSSTASGPLRSRSSDRKRPTSEKSDTSSASSTVSSPRNQQLPRSNSKQNISTRGVSPSSRIKPRPPSPIVRSKSPSTTNLGESPKLKSSMSKESPSSKRPPSPARKRTPMKDLSHSIKSTPPTIKQSLTPTTAMNRSKKNSPNSAPPVMSSLSKMKKSKKSDETSRVVPNVPAKDRANLQNKTFKVITPEGDSNSSKPTVGDQTQPPRLMKETNLQRPTPIPAPTKTMKVEDRHVIGGGESKEDNEEVSEPKPSEVTLADELRGEITTTNQALVDPTPKINDDVITTESLDTGKSTSLSTDDAVNDLISNTIKEAKNELQTEIKDVQDVMKDDTREDNEQAVEDDKQVVEDGKQILENNKQVVEDDKQIVEDDKQVVKDDKLALDEKQIEISNNVETKEDEKEEVSTSQTEVQQIEEHSTPTIELNKTSEPNNLPLDSEKPFVPVQNSTGPPETQSSNLATSASSVSEKPSASVPSKPATAADKPSVPEETKKKEKKVSAEEQAYKDAIAAKRREMKEKREREERERQERLRIEAEEQARREEDARRMAEEARIENERLMEEERLKKEEQELKKKKEAEEIAKKHEEFLQAQRERLEQKAREEAEKQRQDRKIAAQKQDEERSERKKRLQMIMRRTRGGDSPSSDNSKNNTPVGGNSPLNSTTPDRVCSPVNVDKKESESIPEMNISTSLKPQANAVSDQVETISLENSASDNPVKMNGSSFRPTVITAFEDPSNVSSENSDPFAVNNLDSANNSTNSFNVNGTTDDPFQLRQTGDFNHSVPPPNDNVATGNLLGL